MKLTSFSENVGKVLFDGLNFRKDSRNKYFIAEIRRNGQRKKFLLHRYIYEKVFGKIPENYQIHHKDHNTNNNLLENLELLEKHEHRSYHTRKMYENEEYRERNKEQLEEIRDKATQWHKSEIGRQWHIQHAQKTNFGKFAYNKTCEFCGKDFVSGKADGRFCSSSCEQKHYFRTRRKIIKCEVCGKEHEVYKYSKIRYCSKQCANKARHSL